jgi:hypothetical protein
LNPFFHSVSTRALLSVFRACTRTEYVRDKKLLRNWTGACADARMRAWLELEVSLLALALSKGSAISWRPFSQTGGDGGHPPLTRSPHGGCSKQLQQTATQPGSRIKSVIIPSLRYDGFFTMGSGFRCPTTWRASQIIQVNVWVLLVATLLPPSRGVSAR